MSHLSFTRKPYSPEERLLYAALFGEAETFDVLFKENGIEPQSIAVFYAVAHDFGVEEKHFLLFELAKRGNFPMFWKLVHEYGLSPRIYEEEYERCLAEELLSEQRAEELKLPIVHDDVSRWRATRSAYHCSLSEFMKRRREEAWEKLCELGEKWHEVNRTLRSLGKEADGVLDEGALEAYRQTHETWRNGLFGLVTHTDEEAHHRHKRARPLINPRFEKELERRRLRKIVATYKTESRTLLETLKGIEQIRACIASSVG